MTAVHAGMEDPLSKKVIDPVALDGETVAVSVTGPTGGDGFGLTVTVVDEAELEAVPMTMFDASLRALVSCDVATLKVAFE